VFLTLGYSLPLHETGGGIHPLTITHNGLLAPFLDGMFAAASDSVVIVDGQEHAYPYRQPAQFAAKADSMRRGVLRLVADPPRYAKHLSVGFGIWLDNESERLGWNETDPGQNYFTPEAFAVAVQAAFDHSDRYVWIYSQKPRWWSAAGHPLRMSAAYDSVLRRIRR
jgi:hypothetical protein